MLRRSREFVHMHAATTALRINFLLCTSFARGQLSATLCSLSLLPLHSFMQTTWKLSKYKDVAHLVLRLPIAAAFLYHGTMKFGFLQGSAPEGMSDTLVMIFKFLAIAEPLAGIALLIGLLTQVAAAGVALVMVCAIYFKASGGFDFGKVELEIILLAASVALVIEGAGAYSLDAKMR